MSRKRKYHPDRPPGRPKRPQDYDGLRYCGHHEEYHDISNFTGSERICRKAKWVRHIHRKYGLTVDQYEAMVGDGICTICRIRPHKYIDHNHTTGEVRGLLCQPCNTALGAFMEDEEVFLRAMSYLGIGR